MVEQVAPHLCKSKYGEAHWDENQGAVYGKETVISGGLAIISGRRVHYGRVDAKAARNIVCANGIVHAPAACAGVASLSIISSTAQSMKRSRNSGDPAPAMTAAVNDPFAQENIPGRLGIDAAVVDAAAGMIARPPLMTVSLP